MKKICDEISLHFNFKHATLHNTGECYWLPTSDFCTDINIKLNGFFLLY